MSKILKAKTMKYLEGVQTKNMGEYHDLYLISDILLLTDVFEDFRKTCLQYYKLDPCMALFHKSRIILGCYGKND